MLKKCKIVVCSYIEYSGVHQHLYVLSKDKIIGGDWSFDSYTSKTIKVPKDKSFIGILDKIIATTDPKLQDDGIAKIPHQFVNDYFTKLNEGEVINHINVEYQKFWYAETIDFNYKSLREPHHGEIPKLGIDKTIIIHKIKNSWAREEVIVLINKFAFEFKAIDRKISEQLKWIEENL
jgi:hypothetical protein